MAALKPRPTATTPFLFLDDDNQSEATIALVYLLKWDDIISFSEKLLALRFTSQYNFHSGFSLPILVYIHGLLSCLEVLLFHLKEVVDGVRPKFLGTFGGGNWGDTSYGRHTPGPPKMSDTSSWLDV